MDELKAVDKYKYIKCLMDVNETAVESTIGNLADFEFSEPTEAIIFSQWMGAVLPIDESKPPSLPRECEYPLPSELDSFEEWQPLLSESMVSFNVNVNHLLARRYVLFVPPLTETIKAKLIGQYEEFHQADYSQIINGIEKKGLNPQHFVLVELDKGEYPKYNEPYWQYVAGCYFRNKGYLVTRRKPKYLRGGGRTDMCAYKTPSVLNPLRRHKFVKRGCFLCELELPLIFHKATESPADDETEEHSVVVEAKCKTGDASRAEDQLISRGGKGGYLEDGHFDEGYIAGPDFHPRDKVGTISNTADGKLLHCERKTKKPSWSSPTNKKNVLQQVERLAKLVLAKNLSFSRLLLLCGHKPYREITFSGFLKELSKVLEHMTVDEVCSLVQEERLNRF